MSGSGKKKKKNSNYITRKDLETKDGTEEFEKNFKPIEYMKKPGVVIYVVVLVVITVVLFVLHGFEII